jgi:glycosyltransferase involved in cell wall biosynthesis
VNNFKSQVHFSIAIPVLGQAEFLQTALSSIQVQAGCFQLAVMDATSDSSVQIILQNYSQIICYQRHGPDAGQSVAIQEGWDHTDGDIVAWLCADDYYFPYTLEEVSKIFTIHPEIDVVYGDSVFVDREGNFQRYFVEIDDDISTILKSCCISQPSCFLRRSALDRIGKLNPQLHYTMDWDLWIRLYQSGAKFYYLKKPLSVVRMYPETKTASRSKARYTEIYSHLRSHVGFLHWLWIRLGFYYSDIKRGEKTVLEKGIFHFLSLLRSIRCIIRKNSKKNKSILYGIDASLNLVMGECEVYLPFYGKQEPCLLIIECRDVSVLQVCVNDSMQEISSVSYCGDISRFFVKIKEGLIGTIMKLKLASNSTRSWKLISLNIS